MPEAEHLPPVALREHRPVVARVVADRQRLDRCSEEPLRIGPDRGETPAATVVGREHGDQAVAQWREPPVSPDTERRRVALTRTLDQEGALSGPPSLDEAGRVGEVDRMRRCDPASPGSLNTSRAKRSSPIRWRNGFVPNSPRSGSPVGAGSLQV